MADADAAHTAAPLSRLPLHLARFLRNQYLMCARQAFTSLAYGSKGALYFCYWTPSVLLPPQHSFLSSTPRYQGSDFGWGNALMSPVVPYLPNASASAAGNVSYMPTPHFYAGASVLFRCMHFPVVVE